MSMDRFYPYPTDCQRPAKKQKRQHRAVLADMPSLFSNSSSSSTRFLNVPQFTYNKSNVQPATCVHDDVDEFLSSEFELSFASTMSLNSPPRESDQLPQESPVPMDISPAPTRVYPSEVTSATKPTGRPRAFTSSARLFGRDLSNDRAPTPTQATAFSGASTATETNVQRAPLPCEWLASTPSEPLENRSSNMFAPVGVLFLLSELYLIYFVGQQRCHGRRYLVF